MHVHVTYVYNMYVCVCVCVYNYKCLGISPWGLYKWCPNECLFLICNPKNAINMFIECNKYAYQNYEY